MRYAVFSDVHANLPALEALVAATCADADAYVSLGDLVGYGPWNDECLELARGLPGIVLLEGHHERLFAGAESVAREHPLVQEFFRASRALFTRPDLVRDLPAESAIGGFRCRHAAGPDPEGNWFVGRTHEPSLRETPRGRLVNVGSAGHNRRRLDAASFALYDSGTGAVTLKEIPYAAGRFLRELESRRYPAACLEYVRRKLASARAA
jgi:hypothetical protein